MVINALYKKYFQKSKIFIYPLLDIKRGTQIVPSETYLAWNDLYSPEDKIMQNNLDLQNLKRMFY
jgi:hypothetical protein